MKRVILRLIALTGLILIGLLSVQPTRALAQTALAETQMLVLSDDQIAAWMGREAQIKHPAVPRLKHQDAATLHFYYEMAYERRAQDVIKSAPMARLKNARFLPEKAVEGVHIYLLGSLNTYFEAQKAPGRAPEWASGLSILRDDVILIRLKPLGTTRIEPERTLAHELNHVALRRVAGDSYFPHWFYEGLAMLTTDDWGINRAETLAQASMNGQLLDLNAIDAAFGKTGATVELAYAESAHFTSWLAKSFGDDSIRQLITRVSQGEPFNDAFIAAFDRSPNAAFALWHDVMAQKKSFLASLGSGDAIFFYMSVFAGVALVIALVRRRRIRKARLESMADARPVSELPENLRHFGPFTK